MNRRQLLHFLGLGAIAARLVVKAEAAVPAVTPPVDGFRYVEHTGAMLDAERWLTHSRDEEMYARIRSYESNGGLIWTSELTFTDEEILLNPGGPVPTHGDGEPIIRLFQS